MRAIFAVATCLPLPPTRRPSPLSLLHAMLPSPLSRDAGMWGSAAHGLEPPLNLTNVPLHIVKTSNATHAHYGEMSGGQPWVVV